MTGTHPIGLSPQRRTKIKSAKDPVTLPGEEGRYRLDGSIGVSVKQNPLIAHFKKITRALTNGRRRHALVRFQPGCFITPLKIIVNRYINHDDIEAVPQGLPVIFILAFSISSRLD